MEPPPPFLLLNLTTFKPFTFNLGILLLIMLILVFISALLSGSEVAMFSLTNKDKSFLREEKDNKKSQRILALLDAPKHLLATIIITNNLVNVSIVMLSSFVMEYLFVVENLTKIGAFLNQVVLVTFIILLFGEVIPKVYANNYSIVFSKFMSFPISVLKILFSQVSRILISST